MTCPACSPSQADVISRTDEELRSEMVEMQAQVAQWVTEQKHSADTVALKGVRILETDKGERTPTSYAQLAPSSSPAD